MKYILKVLFEAVVIAMIAGVAIWYLVTDVLPDLMG